MVRRAIAAVTAVGLSLALVSCLTGCQSTPAGAFTRSMAQADVAEWTAQAVRAADGGTQRAQTKLSAFENCRSDHAYITTTFQWRTITNIDVAAARQAAATHAIETALENNDWRVSSTHGLVTMTGPESQKRRGLITIQTAGPTQEAISVVSPCYS